VISPLGSAASPAPRPAWRVRLARVAVVAVGLVLWFWTQSLIDARAMPAAGSAEAGALLTAGDGLLALTAPLNRLLHDHPAAADLLLIASSAVIDLLGLFLIAQAVFGSSVRPFLALAILFALRQVCQALSALPAPEGMIWRSPGVPSLLVTYGVANDFFFSGHTAIAVLGARELGRLRSRVLASLGAAVALLEALAVIALRAHYTMDVFAGAVTALLAAAGAARLAPACDRWLEGRLQDAPATRAMKEGDMR
jgi:membrane-associated phospholipid phosphatase